ncbi:MAG: ABC transporter ATP-binding protein [Microthrixaceae bacterium]
MRELPRISLPMTIGYAAITIALGAFPTATMLANGVLIGRLPAAADSGVNSQAARSAVAALVVVGVIAILAWTTETFGALLREHLARVASRRWDQELMAAVAAPATIAHLEDPAVLDRLEAAAGRTRAGPAQAVAVVGPVVTNILTGVFAIALVARFSPPLALALLVQSLGQRVHWRARFDRITTAIFGQGDLHRRSGYVRNLAMTPAAAKEVRIFGFADWVLDRFDGEWRSAMTPVWHKMRQGWERSLGVSFAATITLAVGSWMVVNAALDQRISLTVAIVTLQAMMGLDGLAGADDFQHMLAEGADRVPLHRAIVTELHSLAADDGPLHPNALPAGAPNKSIVFDSVSFRYPGSGAPILDSFDLEIEAGRSIAIVGVNGAGKTTLVKLLAGLHRPDSGRILIDDEPLASFDPKQWQRRVSAIFQDFWHYPLSVRVNIGFGAPERMDDQEALGRAAARAGTDSVIAALPLGWDTVLDRQFDGGTELSGGQWQRIALARSLFAVEAGASVLVLDEPTAALDVRAEADIYDRFLDITRGLTSVVISHRFSTVRRADRIVVLDAGRVVEDGTHASLVQAGGRYAHMFELQAARYRDTPAEADEVPA